MQARQQAKGEEPDDDDDCDCGRKRRVLRLERERERGREVVCVAKPWSIASAQPLAHTSPTTPTMPSLNPAFHHHWLD